MAVNLKSNDPKNDYPNQVLLKIPFRKKYYSRLEEINKRLLKLKCVKYTYFVWPKTEGVLLYFLLPSRVYNVFAVSLHKVLPEPFKYT